MKKSDQYWKAAERKQGQENLTYILWSAIRPEKWLPMENVAKGFSKMEKHIRGCPETSKRL